SSFFHSCFCSHRPLVHRILHSFPTRRSSDLMVALPTSAKLKSDVPTRSIGRHRVRTGAASPGGPDLERQIEFHTRPVFMRPEFVVGRSKRIQQCTDARSGSRDRPLMNITHFHGPDPGMKSTKAQVVRAAT